ncbi:MAG: FkbM family methyltransferase [Rhodospirillaceae bacterium]
MTTTHPGEAGSPSVDPALDPVATVPCRHGTLSFFRHDAPIGPALELYGEWAEIEVALLTGIINPGAVVIDVGAHVGVHTVALAGRVGPTGKVLAIEPQATLFSLLQRNIKQNNLNQVVPCHIGIAETSGELCVPFVDYAARGNFGAIQLQSIADAADTAGGRTVSVRTIDDLDLERCNLIKIDAEGMTERVLTGAACTLARCRPYVYSECNSIEDAWSDSRRMAGAQYSTYFFRFSAFNPENFRGNSENLLFGDAHESGLLFVPIELTDHFQVIGADFSSLIKVSSLTELAELMLVTPRYRSPADEGDLDDAGAARIATLEAALEQSKATIAKLQRTLSSIQRNVITKSGLFDAEFYLETNPELRASGIDPLRHYVQCGAEERRNPNPYFDSGFYIENSPDSVDWGINPLAHYILYGAGWGRNPGPHFNTSFYVGTYPDVLASHLSPLAHFLTIGAAEGRCPNQFFNPLYNRLDDWTVERAIEACPPQEVTADKLAALATHRLESSGPAAEVLIDVIIPVYRGLAETLNCLLSVLKAPVATPHEVIVIDDAGPDPELKSELEALAATNLITLVRHPVNLGFVATVNHGMGLHPDRDVVLLNSDTEVYGNWLDRLRAAAWGQARIGSVSPLSNNATICSYPVFNRNNACPDDVGYEELDRLAASANPDGTVEIPTTVGFCMYIRRDCLDETGPFDVDAFPRGYGEENDFCMRASARGWTHLLAGNVFVRHYGSVSFGAEKSSLIENGYRTLRARFPKYESIIRDFLIKDTARPLRQRLDVTRIRHHAGKRSMLLITHRLGGGTERHVLELSARLEAEGVAAFVLRAQSQKPGFARLTHPGLGPIPNLTLDLDQDMDGAIATLEKIGISHIHVHHLIDFGLRPVTRITEIASRLGIPYDVTVHDYLPICPRVNLIDGSGRYCGEPPIESCELCIRTNSSPFGRVPLAHWRAGYAELLTRARRVFVPDSDVASRLGRYFPEIPFTVRAHFETRPAGRGGGAAPRSDSTLRVAVIGAIGPHKGSDILLGCARDAEARGLPLKFTIFGYSDKDDLLKLHSNITITGPYADPDIHEILRGSPCHVCLLPSVWPETYSYTLSIALDAGLFPVAFDLGALAERIRKSGRGELLPITWMTDPAKINDRLLELDIPPVPEFPDLHSDIAYPNFMSDYYGLPPGRPK